MPPEQTPAGKPRLGAHVRDDLMQRLKATLRRLPREITLSDLVEVALETELDRIDREGWNRPIPVRKNMRLGRPLK